MDVERNVYATITIGAQMWMRENLATTSYRDGTQVLRVEDNENWSSVVTGAYCHPALKPSMQAEGYGLLYNFHAISDGRGLCPDGCNLQLFKGR